MVSQLELTRKQQVASLAKASCGITAAAIRESEEIDKQIEDGKYNVVYGSAE